MRAVVQGGARGLGRALALELVARDEEVIVTCRRPDQHAAELMAAGVEAVLPLDLEQPATIEEAAQQVRDRWGEVDRLIVTGGLLHDGELQPEKRLEHLRAEHLLRLFSVNSVGPALVARHFLPLMMHGRRAELATLSARVGSIGDNRLGGWYGYRASKAAQNQLVRTLAIELSRRAPAVIAVTLHPGTVATDLSAPFQRGVPPHKLFTPERAARQLLDVLDARTPADGGACFAWDGEVVPP